MAADALGQFVRVTLAPRALAAEMTVLPGVDPATLDELSLRALAAEHHVLVDADVSAQLRALAERLKTLPAPLAQPLTVTVARGAPPSDGQDGRLEFAPGMDPAQLAAAPPSGAAARAEPAASPTPTNQPALPPDAAHAAEGVDHYARSAFRPVAVGQLVATLIPPTSGVDGRDVCGKTLAARDGRPFPLGLDESLQQQPDGTIIARVAGVIEFDPPRLRVREELVIAGSVDFSTGHVDFPGSVTIERGVRDCFRVRAGRHVRVRGLVEAATIDAGLDADLAGGMSAREKGGLTTGRDASARYLKSVNVRTGRDLRVQKELLTSQVVVGRDLLAPAAVVTGGRVTVARAAQIAAAGGESHAATEIRLGYVSELENFARDLLGLRALVEQRHARAAGDLDKLRTTKRKLTSIEADQLTELQFALATAQGQLKSIDQRLERLRALARDRTCVDLTVLKRIHPGVRILAWKWTLDVAHEVRGPVRITLDPRGELLIADPATGSPVAPAAVGTLRASDAMQLMPGPSPAPAGASDSTPDEAVARRAA